LGYHAEHGTNKRDKHKEFKKMLDENVSLHFLWNSLLSGLMGAKDLGSKYSVQSKL